MLTDVDRPQHVPRMHADEIAIDIALVRALLRAQFPQWAHLPVPAEKDICVVAGTSFSRITLSIAFLIHEMRVALSIVMACERHEVGSDSRPWADRALSQNSACVYAILHDADDLSGQDSSLPDGPAQANLTIPHFRKASEVDRLCGNDRCHTSPRRASYPSPSRRTRPSRSRSSAPPCRPSTTMETASTVRMNLPTTNQGRTITNGGIVSTVIGR